MPIAPTLPPEVMAKAGVSAPTSPVNFLMAAADMSKAGSLTDTAKGRSAPMPSSPGRGLQSGKAPSRSGKIRMMK